MDSFQVLEMIKNGENSYVEFKTDRIKAKDLADEIIAFANSEGGIILIGVADDGSIEGVKTENTEETIMNICRNNCIPPIVPRFDLVSIENKDVAVVAIPKGSNKPYYSVDNKYYIRVGTTKRIASKEELLRLFEASGATHYDITAVNGTAMKDLDLDNIRDYYKNYNAFDLLEESEESKERILLNADILKKEEDKIACTVGGILIFGKNPERYLPQNGVSFAHFAGNEISDELIDKKVVLGRVQDIAEQLMVIMKNNIRTPSAIIGIKREEKEDYPLIVLREAIVNSLVHRNYSIVGSKIRIFMFDDRIEFRTPGRLPNTVTVDKMKIGVSYARNPFLVKYMENMRYIDQLGRGIPMILRNMADLGAKEPSLSEVGEEFILTIFKPN